MNKLVPKPTFYFCTNITQMLIAKNNFLEFLLVQLRLILSRKSRFYSILYSDSDCDRVGIEYWTLMQDSSSHRKAKL